MRKCERCGEEKPHHRFHNHALICKKCKVQKVKWKPLTEVQINKLYAGQVYKNVGAK